MEIPYELLIKYCRKQTSEEENKKVTNWLSYEENFKLFGTLKKEWIYIDDDSAVIPDEKIVWQNIIKKTQQRNKKSGKRINLKKVMISSAAIIIIFALSISIYTIYKPVVSTTQEHYLTINSKTNEKYQTILSDGTSLWLNSNSSISYSDKFNTNNREITLDGELFIEVEPSDKPFIINTDKIKIEVLGTSFNIKAYRNEDQIKIDLLKGRIAIINLENGNKIMEMNAPQNFILNKKNMNYTINTEISTSNTWASEALIINNEPLNEVINKLENWYNIEIYHKGMDTTKYYTFQLQNENIYEFLELFSFLTPIDYEIKENKLYIESKKDN